MRSGSIGSETSEISGAPASSATARSGARWAACFGRWGGGGAIAGAAVECAVAGSGERIGAAGGASVGAGAAVADESAGDGSLARGVDSAIDRVATVTMTAAATSAHGAARARPGGRERSRIIAV